MIDWLKPFKHEKTLKTFVQMKLLSKLKFKDLITYSVKGKTEWC